MEHESDGNTDCNWCTRNGPKRFGKGTGRAGNQRTYRDHPKTTILQKSARILKRVLET